MASRLNARVMAGPALASDSNTGARSLSSLTRVSLVWLRRVGNQRTEFAELIERVHQVLPLVGQRAKRIRDGLQRPVHHGLLVRELADQVVEALGRGDDVIGLAG